MNTKKHKRLRELVLEYDGTQTKVFEEIVQILTPCLRMRYVRITKNEDIELMDETINLTLMKLHESFPNAPADLRVHGAVTHAYGQLINARRIIQHKHKQKLMDHPERLPELPTDNIEDQCIEQEEHNSRIDQVCAEVPPFCRRAVRLVAEGCSWEETRATLGLTRGSWHHYTKIIRRNIRNSSVLNNRPVETGADEHGGRRD